MRRINHALTLLGVSAGIIASFFAGLEPAWGQTQTVIAPELTGNELLNYVVTNYKPSTTLGYTKATDTLYRRIDLKSGNQLSCIYSAFTITLDTTADPSTDAYYKGINCEHSWPQSMGASSEPQRSDLHHLYPSKDNVNSSRGNNPYMEIPDYNTDVWYRLTVSQTTIPTSNLDEWAEKENNTPTGFEPREISKGNVARSCFYFFAMYNSAVDTNFWNAQKYVLYQWHYADPVDQDEYDRTYRIASYQSNKPNPFVLDSTLARRIWFTDGYTAPSPSELQAGDIAIIGANCDDPDDFAFVTLTDINASTQIYFTDNGWLSSNAFRTGEGTVCYTAPAKVPAGTVIVYSQNTGSFTSSGYFALSTSGDQILAYQGSATTPRFLYAINIKGSAVWQSDATDANTSALPQGLVNGSTCVALTEKDNVKYNGATNFSNRNAALLAISNYQNWIGNDATRYDFTQIGDFSLPVELVDFAAVLEQGTVMLRWVTESEIENLGFNLYRRLLGENYHLLASFRDYPALIGQGSSSQRKSYSFTDNTVQPATTYNYLLSDVDYAGRETFHHDRVVTIAVPLPDTPVAAAFELGNAFPNPFNFAFTVPLKLTAPATVILRLYDLNGVLVQELEQTPLSAGNYQLRYRLPDIPSGIYLLQVGIGNQLKTQKIVLLK